MTTRMSGIKRYALMDDKGGWSMSMQEDEYGEYIKLEDLPVGEIEILITASKIVAGGLRGESADNLSRHIETVATYMMGIKNEQ